jgi:hypothetical protein
MGEIQCNFDLSTRRWHKSFLHAISSAVYDRSCFKSFQHRFGEREAELLLRPKIHGVTWNTQVTRQPMTIANCLQNSIFLKTVEAQSFQSSKEFKLKNQKKQVIFLKRGAGVLSINTISISTLIILLCGM